MSNAADLTTPQLVREYTAIKCSAARGEMTTPETVARLRSIVDELRNRRVLD